MNSYEHPEKHLLNYIFDFLKYDLHHKRLTATELSKLIVREQKNRMKLIDLCHTLFYCKHSVFKSISENSLLLLNRYARRIPKNAVVIVPGESPSRVPILLQLFFGNGTDHLDLDIDGYDGTKISFVQFPISGLKPDLEDKEFEIIKAYVKSKIPFDTASLYILDYHFQNRSYQFFQELFPNIKKINQITMPGIIPDAEHFDARCVDAYYVTHENEGIFSTNFLHCNLTTLLMALRMTLNTQDVEELNMRYEQHMFAKLFDFVIPDIINASRQNNYNITYMDRFGQTRTVSDAFLLCRNDWHPILMDQYAIVNIRMLLLIVPRPVLYARNAINAKNAMDSKKRKREGNSDYLYFKTLPTVVKVFPFFILSVSKN